MATTILRPCTHPGCPNLVGRGPCQDHARARERRRGYAAKRGYGSRHQKQRLIVLARDPICRGCEQAESTVDDHIVPIATGGSASDDQNQQGLCVECHGYKTAIEQRDAFFGIRLREEGQKLGEPAPHGWRHLKMFGGERDA